jgi:phosphoribosylformimino-5-aminoimidazole carboxamide ribotide isomerase
LAEMDVPGVITGKAIYEGKISLADIEKYNL